MNKPPSTSLIDGSIVKQPPYSQAVRRLVAGQVQSLSLGPNCQWTLQQMAAYVTCVAIETALITADRRISRQFVRRVIAEECSSNLWNAPIGSMVGIRPMPKRTR